MKQAFFELKKDWIIIPAPGTIFLQKIVHRSLACEDAPLHSACEEVSCAAREVSPWRECGWC